MQHIILFRSTTTTTSPTILHIVNSVSTAQHSIIVMPPRLPHKAAIQQIFSPVLPASSTASRHAIIPTLRTYASRTNQAQQSSWQDQVAAGRVSSSIPASLGQRELSKVSEEWSALTGLASNVMNSDATTNTADSFKDTFNFFAKPRGNQTNSQKAAVDLSNDISEASLSRLRTKFVEGELYKPSDLSFEAYTKANNEVRRTRNQNKILVEGNVFKKHKITPIKHYKNFNFLAEFVTDMGRIKHRDDTHLSAVDQRRMAKTIRRAIGIGLLPSVHKHPEVLRRTQARSQGRLDSAKSLLL